MTKVPRRAGASGTTTKTPAKAYDPAPLAKIFADFRKQKNAAEAAVIEANRLRDEELMPALIKHGEAYGETGAHLAIELPEEIDGFVRLVRRANTSRLIDIDAAEKLLKKKGVLDQAKIVTVTITGVPATQLEELSAAIEKLRLERKFGVLPDISTHFDQTAMYAIHQRHRQELQDREEAGDKIGVRERSKYLTEEELDGLVVTETTYSFHPSKT